MAKFAVLILAALAFQAASAGVFMQQRFQENTLGDYEYGLQLHGYPTGKFDALFGELQTVSQDLSVYFQKALPNDRLVIKTLVWQSRELAQYIDTIIERLEAEVHNYSGQVSIVLEHFISELRDIRVQYQQIAGYTTDVYAVSQLKNQFYLNVQRTVVQLEKLVRLVQTDFEQSKGELYVIVKNVVSDFLYAFKNIFAHLQYYGVYGEQSAKQLVLQIQEVTNGLTGYVQGFTYLDAHRNYAVHEFVQHVEAIISRMQEVEGTYGNIEIDAIFQQVYGKLRRVLVPFLQLVETENIENVEAVRVQLIKELQFVAEAFEQFVQYTQAGEYQTFFFEVLGDYLYALQQFRIQLQSGYQGYYGNYQSGFYGQNQSLYGKSRYQGLYNYGGLNGKTGYQGLYKYGGLYGKAGYQEPYQYAGLYSKAGYQVPYQYAGLYSKAGYQGPYQYGGLSGKVGYQGLYKYGGLYDKSGYGYFSKYQGFAKYAQDLNQFEVQIQTIIRDFYQSLQTVSYDDATTRQTLVYLIREYAQQLEFIVEKFHQYVNYNAESDVYVFKQVAQNLRQYVLALQQFYTSEYSAVELRTQFYLYVQKISTEFEKLISGIEQSNGTLYNIVRDVLYQYLSVTNDLYKHVQNISEIAQYGYGPYARQYYGDNYSAGKYYGAQYYGENYYGGKYYGKYVGGKYGQYYGLQGQQSYETPRELVNQIQYGKGYGYDKYAQQYGYSKQYNQLAQYGSEYGLEGRQYGYGLKGKTVEQLVYQIQAVAAQVADEFQTVAVSDKQFRHIFFAQARQLGQIIDNIIDRFQVEYIYGNDNTVQQVISNLRQIRVQLQQIVSSGAITTVYQIKAQIANYFQEVASELKQLALVAQTDLQHVQIVENVLVHYIFYLHNVQYQLQYNVYGYQGYQSEYGYQHVPYNGNYLASNQYNQDAIRGY